MDGTGNIGCTNKAKGNVAFCQTVLPGNEAMLIPTNIEDWAQLAVPGPDYWAGTAAQLVEFLVDDDFSLTILAASTSTPLAYQLKRRVYGDPHRTLGAIGAHMSQEPTPTIVV